MKRLEVYLINSQFIIEQMEEEFGLSFQDLEHNQAGEYCLVDKDADEQNDKRLEARIYDMRSGIKYIACNINDAVHILIKIGRLKEDNYLVHLDSNGII